MIEGQNQLLFQALEQLAQLMEDISTPENIRHDLSAIILMANTNKVAHDIGLDFLNELEIKAPTFASLYNSVMLRSIREAIRNEVEEE